MIRDQHHRNHNYLRISLTERCNLRCFYCMPEEGIELRDKAEFMSSEEVIGIATKFVELGVDKIRITGGEPLIKKDIKNILTKLAELPVELHLTTNGILLDKHLDLFKEIGLKNINISLDSLEEDLFNQISKRNYFDRIMSNIKLYIEHGFNIKINVVLMKGVNDHEINDFIKWTIDQPLSVRFIEFMPFGGNKWNTEKVVSFQTILNAVHAEFGTNQIVDIPLDDNATTRRFRVEGAKGDFGIISSVTNPFCDTCNRIRLTADGKIKNCLFSADEIDLLSAYRAEEDIEPLIKGSILKKFKKRAGIKDFSNDSIHLFEKNRNMTSIGG